MRLALFEPDIPQNTGTLLRLAACLGVGLDIIEPCGFLFDDRRLDRAAMDYLARASYVRHASWAAFQAARQRDAGGGRLVLLTTQARLPYTAFGFRPDDVLLLGRESSGVPPEVRAAAQAQVVIPLQPGLRSINVALAGAMVLGEALRQTGLFPAERGESDR